MTDQQRHRQAAEPLITADIDRPRCHRRARSDRADQRRRRQRSRSTVERRHQPRPSVGRRPRLRPTARSRSSRRCQDGRPPGRRDQRQHLADGQDPRLQRQRQAAHREPLDRGPDRRPASAPTAKSTAPPATADIGGNDVRKNLVTQFNELRDQLDKFADDASFNGINLLRGDKLKLTFNETGTSTIDIQAKDEDGNATAINTTTLGIDHRRQRRLRQRRHARHQARQARRRARHAAVAGVVLRLEPVDRAEPPGLHQEHDQHAARPARRTSTSPTPTRKRPTCSPCRPASSCPRRRCRWPRRPTRPCCACSKPNSRRTRRKGGLRPAFFFACACDHFGMSKLSLTLRRMPTQLQLRVNLRLLLPVADDPRVSGRDG